VTLIPWGEYRGDVSDYEGQYSRNILNVLPRGDGYGPFPDFAAFSAALGATCRGYFYARKSDGSVVIFAATSVRLYKLNNTDLTWTDVSKGGPSDYSAVSSNAQWQFAQFNNFVFAVQANVAPQVFDLSSSTQFADLGGTPPQAAYISIVGRFVVLSGLLSNPYRIQWSGLNATTTWTSGTNQSDFQDLPDGGIVRGVAGGESGVIFQDTTMRRMTYTAGTTVFQIERITEDSGLLGPYSIIRAGDRIFYLSAKGFQVVGPGIPPTPIGKERIDRTFTADFDANNLQLLIGVADPNSTRVFWCYKSKASGNTAVFDKMLCYDWGLDRWVPISMTGEYAASLAAPGTTLDALDSISGSLDALTFSLDSVAASALTQISICNSSHKIGFFTGANLEATLESSEHGAAPNRIFVRGFRPITDAPSCYGAVSARENQQSTAVYAAENIIDARGLVPARVDTRYARGKVRIPASTVWTFALGIEPEVETMGTR